MIVTIYVKNILNSYRDELFFCIFLLFNELYFVEWSNVGNIVNCNGDWFSFVEIPWWTRRKKKQVDRKEGSRILKFSNWFPGRSELTTRIESSSGY